MNSLYYYYRLFICSFISSSQAMNMTGLYESAYWASWISWEGIITFISSLFLVLFGLMFQFDFFKKNNFGVLFFVFFLFQINMVRSLLLLQCLVSFFFFFYKLIHINPLLPFLTCDARWVLPSCCRPSSARHHQAQQWVSPYL